MKTQFYIFLAAALTFLLIGYFVSLVGFPAEYAFVSNIFIVLMALPSFYFFCKSVGLKKGLLGLISLALFAQFIEAQAIITGFPYSEFQYSDKISGKLFGIVPWTIGFAWTPLLLASVYVASRWTVNKSILILISAITLVGFDLILDPGATAAGLWIWENPSGFYNVPLQNFFGWFVSGLIGTIIFLLHKIDRQKLQPAILLSAIFTLAFWTGAAIYFNFALVVVLGTLTTSYLLSQLK